jgi:hypothetical protein
MKHGSVDLVSPTPYLASHGPKSSNGTVIISLKSKQAPHTKRFTVMSGLIFLISGSISSTTLDIASRLSDVALSPSYLQRHSRQTRLKDMAPLARGTLSADRADDDGVGGTGAKADADARAATNRTIIFIMTVLRSSREQGRAVPVRAAVIQTKFNEKYDFEHDGQQER